MRLNHGFVFRQFTVALAVAVLCMQAQAEHITKIQASQLVTNGESFFQASNITSELTRLARADGYIGASESFKTVSVSGASLGSIIGQYKSCNPKPVYLVSDGAGIDLMNSGDMTKLGNQLKDYLNEMKKSGTKKLLWMIYPDPQGGSWATLKKNQDSWAVTVPPIINACTEPKTLLIDLRPVWAGKYSQYTSDGIHCTNAGGTATAEAFWKMMKDSNFFDLPTTYAEPLTIEKTTPSALLGQSFANGNIAVALNINQPSNVMLTLTTVSGRSVVAMQRYVSGTGEQRVAFPLGAVARGLYCSEIRAGQLTSRSTLLVP